MPEFSTPEWPRLSLRVGVSGHRPGPRLPVRHIERVAGEVRSILHDLESATRHVKRTEGRAFESGGTNLTLISALAEGADRIAAHEALKRGWMLDVVLPLAQADYEQDFKQESSRHEFRDLLGAARHVFRLLMDAAPPHRPRAYEAASHLTLDNCDVLLVVWDGKPGLGRGGTASLVAEALQRDVPVLRVHATAREPATLLRRNRVPAVLREDLAGLVAKLLAPQGDPREMDRYFDEAGADAAASEGQILRWWRFSRGFAAMARVLGPTHRAHAPELAPIDAGRNAAQPSEILLRRRYDAADAISTHLGHVYRSAFTLVFLASALAVIAGLCAVFWWTDPMVKAGFVVVEIGFILLIVGLTLRGRRRGWHSRWLDTRRLAELLRVTAAMLPAGGSSAIAPSADGEGKWTEWYARASLRETHMPNATADAAYLRKMADGFVADLVDGQIDYHRQTAARLLRLHHGLDRIGLILFGLTLLIGIGYVAAAVAMHVAEIHDGRVYERFADWVKPGVTLLSAGLPALGAALYGIRAQGDYEASASRSQSTAAALLDIRERILSAREAPDFTDLRALMAEAGEIMQADLSDWRKIYRHRPIPIPA